MDDLLSLLNSKCAQISVLLISACVYVFYVAAISLLNATSPLMYELTAEMSYPITEEFLGGKKKSTNLYGSLWFCGLFEFAP